VQEEGQLMDFYDDLVRLWSSGKTVWNPGTHVRNFVGNLPFAQLAGCNTLNPANLPYYTKAAQIMRGDHTPLMREMYEHGVVGADYSSAELKGALRGLLPDPDLMGIDKTKPLTFVQNFGRLLSQYVPEKLKRTGSAISAKAHQVYAGTDEFFKIAAYLKHREMGASPAEAAAEVRKWFPYYDNIGSSPALKFIRRIHPFFSFFRESVRILSNAIKERPLGLSASMLVPYALTKMAMGLLGLRDKRDQEEIMKDMKGHLKGTDSIPVFSILLPWRQNGHLAQFDLTNVSPFASLLSSNLDTKGDDLITTTAKQLLTGSPFGNILYAMAANEDAFNDRPITAPDMTGMEKAGARAANIANTLLPPLAPGGSGVHTILNSFDRATDKTLAERSPGQAILRAVLGLDVRNADPSLYRIADDFRKANKLPENVWAGGTNAQQRLRRGLWVELAQDKPDLDRIHTLLQKIGESGKPIATQQDLNRLLFFHNPAMILEGKINQQLFQANLSPEAAQLMQAAQQEFHRITSTAPAIIAQARAR
jgi:hypothetical protein